MPLDIGRALDATGIDGIAACYARNRFIPLPEPGAPDVGDGDFRAIGAEFLRHFVKLGGLAPTDRVLDIGCGIGRMALPLTQYLDPEQGRYQGIDVVAPSIAWCRRRITRYYPNFRFRHLDIANDVYNPQGVLLADQLRLPIARASVDFAFLTSVFTHLRSDAIRVYLQELARVLRPGGRVFVTTFLISPTRAAALGRSGSRLVFTPIPGGAEFLADPDRPSSAVAQSEEWFLDAVADAGLVSARPVAYGSWCGQPGLSYQDISVFQRPNDD